MSPIDTKITTAVYQRMAARSLGRPGPALAYLARKAGQWAEQADDWLNSPAARHNEGHITGSDRAIQRRVYLRIVRQGASATQFTTELAQLAINDTRAADAAAFNTLRRHCQPTRQSKAA